MKVLYIILVSLYTYSCAIAHDHGRTDPAWEQLTPEIQEWYKELMQPDNPTASCCGLADAYYADEIRVKSGKTFAV